LTKSFEQISTKFELDRINTFLGKEENESLFASENGFYSRKSVGLKSKGDFLNNTIGGTQGRFSRSNRLSKFSRFNGNNTLNFGNHDNNKENRGNRVNLVHPYMGIRSYKSYNKMNYKNYLDRTSKASDFSERTLLLEMQK
jgi:hypothetical protein